MAYLVLTMSEDEYDDVLDTSEIYLQKSLSTVAGVNLLIYCEPESDLRPYLNYKITSVNEIECTRFTGTVLCKLKLVD